MNWDDALSELQRDMDALAARIDRIEADYVAAESAALERAIVRAEYDASEMSTKRCETGFHDDCAGQVAGIWDCECRCHGLAETVGADVD